MTIKNEFDKTPESVLEKEALEQQEQPSVHLRNGGEADDLAPEPMCTVTYFDTSPYVADNLGIQHAKLAHHCRMLEAKLAQQEQPASVDAYVGAREDAAIWKKRALEAEELNRKFIAELNGPAYLGEPVKQEQPAAWTRKGSEAASESFCTVTYFDTSPPYATYPAQEQPAQEPVMYQYRWTNPGDNKDVPEFELDWKTVEPRNPNTDTIESRIKELEGYRYNGKPCYEVRALFAAPPTQPAQEPVTRPEPFKMEIPPPPADMLEVVFAEGWNTCCDEFFGGKAPQEPVVITVTTPAPTQPALSDGEIYEIVSNAADELWSGISRVAPWTSEDAEFYEAIVRKVEAHCLGGATP